MEIFSKPEIMLAAIGGYWWLLGGYWLAIGSYWAAIGWLLAAIGRLLAATRKANSFTITACDLPYRGTKLETSKSKTRVGFGRAEVSVWLDYIVFCAVSFGHASRILGFQGFCTRLDFQVFVHVCFV